MESCFLAFFTNILVVLYSIGQQDLGTATTARSRGQLPRSCQWNCHGLWYQLRDPCIHWSLGHSHCSRGTRVDGIIGSPLLAPRLSGSWGHYCFWNHWGHQHHHCRHSAGLVPHLPVSPPPWSPIHPPQMYRGVCCALQRNLCWIMDVPVVVDWRR